MRHVIASLLAGMILGSSAWGESIAGVEFPPSVTFAGKELKLSGTAIYQAERFGLRFKVYVAALYAVEKPTSAEALLESKDPVVIKLAFLRRVDAKDSTEAILTAHKDNCITECESTLAELKKFMAIYPDILNKGTIEYRILPDVAEYDIIGRKTINGKLERPASGRNLLARFIGRKPPSEDFKRGLLGLQK